MSIEKQENGEEDMDNALSLLPYALPYVLPVLGIILLVILIRASYVKASPDEALIISGVTKEPRVLLGKAGFKLPFFERVDRLRVGQIDIDVNTDDYIPTSDFINVQVEAIAQVAVDYDGPGRQAALRNFLNKEQDDIRVPIRKSLEGNLREIIGTMDLRAICKDKTQFSNEVRNNAEQDMAELGIRILSFNVQNINDREGLIDDLGIDNTAEIQKTAKIAKAKAARDIAVEEAKARNDADAANVEAETTIAERNNTLAIRKAELQISEDTKRAEAEAAFGIQTEVQRKTIETRRQEANIAAREKEIELQEREAQVAEKKLDANVRKKAEAEKYAAQQQADAELYARQRDAEAQLFEQQKEAEAVKCAGEAEAERLRLQGEAEAAAIRAKGDAEAEALSKKADAMKKYGEAAILEMLVNVLPDMAKAVAEPLSSIDEVKIIGSNGDGVSNVSGNVPLVLAQTMESVKEATGVDMTEIIRANSYDAKVTRNINVSADSDVADVVGDVAAAALATTTGTSDKPTADDAEPDEDVMAQNDSDEAGNEKKSYRSMQR